MVSRPIVVLVLIFAGIVSTLPAGEFDPCHTIVRDIKRRQCWPKPFTCPDREAVLAPYVVMVSNGWHRQNTLGDTYFEEGTGQLSESGLLKVRWIVTEAPEQHREIYVHRALTAQETVARVSSVQQAAARLMRPGQVVPVLETDIPPQGWPAGQVDAIGRKFEKTTPDPRLPAVSNSGTETK